MVARSWVLLVLGVSCSAKATSTSQSDVTGTESTPPSDSSQEPGQTASSDSSDRALPVAPTTPGADVCVTPHPDDAATAQAPLSSTGAVTTGDDVASGSPTSEQNVDATTAADTEAAPLPAGEPVEEPISVVPTARGEHGVGMLHDEVYVLGGFTPTVTNTVQVYNPASDTWRDAASFPVVFHHPNVASVGDKLYVLGFHAGSGQRQADGGSYAYDPATDEWTGVTPMPAEAKRGAACVTTYQDKVYIFGGTDGEALAEASTYDPAADEWETLPLLPAFRHHCVAAALGDKIYIVSGRDVIIEEVQAESYVYDPAARTYEEVAPILTPRGGAAGGLLGGKIYVFGGEGNEEDPNGIFHETEVYDPATNQWTALPDMALPRHGFGAAVIDDKIYLPAGSKSRGIDVVNTHTVFYLK